MVFRTEDLGLDYPDLLESVKEEGITTESRIGETKEILNLRLELLHPRLCIVSRKGMSQRFMKEEITQLLAGEYNFDRLHAISKTAASLITESTAYGPRTWVQLRGVARELVLNPNSRRAVVYVGRPDDLYMASEVSSAFEMPCTMTWQFHLRQNFLHMTVNMRSWDLVWGLSYDIPSFVAVQLALCDHLGSSLGTYVHNAGSGHVYDRHYSIETSRVPNRTLHIDDLLDGSVDNTRARARAMLKGEA